MKLREYQKKAIVELKNSFIKGNKKVILTLATGAGKSIIALEIVKMALKKQSDVLYLAHRIILINQMQEVFKDMPNVVCETLQTSKNKEHDNIKIIIVDEMHFSVNSKLQDSVINKYPNALIVGLSATPITANGSRIDGWDDILDIVQLKDLIDWGFASPVKVFGTKQINTANIKITAGEYDKKETEQEVTKSFVISGVVDKFTQFASNLKTIFYCINIEHCKKLEHELKSKGFNCATYHSKIPKKDRETIFNNFKDNKIQILCSVETLTTGVDLPDIYCLVLATPTKSLIKAVQIYGRATRLDPKNPNKKALILDCAGVVGDTIHPMGRLDFNRKKAGKFQKCFCGGNLKVIKREAKYINEFEIQTTTTLECMDCKAIKIMEDIKAILDNICLNCGQEVETKQTRTEFIDGHVNFISICPNCGHEETIRKVEVINQELEEIKLLPNTKAMDTWEDCQLELQKAKNKDGKKYHKNWAKHVVNNLQAMGVPREELVNTINLYQKNKWALGGIVNAMQKNICVKCNVFVPFKDRKKHIC